MFKIIILLGLMVSCSGLQKTRKYAVIDSSHRGLEVYDEEKNLIGITPFFYHFKSRKYQEIYYKENGKLVQVKYKCESNWRLSSLVEGFRNCDGYLLIQNKLKNKNRRKAVILPLLPKDVSAPVMEKFSNFFQNNKIDSSIYLDNESFFIKYAIYPESSDFSKLHTETLRYFYKQHGITDIIIFIKENDFYIPTQFDVYTNKVLKRWAKIPMASDTEYDFSFLSRFFQLLPNSVALNYFFQGRVEGTEATSGTDVDLRSDKRDLSTHPDGFPRYLPLISVENILYPYHFDEFDYKLIFAPSINAFAFRYSDSLNGQSYTLELQGYALYYNVYFNFIHPFGTTTMGVGLGAGHINGTDSQLTEFSKFDLLTKFSFFQTVFLNDRLFTQVGINSYSLPDEFSDPSVGPFRPKNYTEFFFSIGYYFPESKKLLKELILN